MVPAMTLIVPPSRNPVIELLRGGATATGARAFARVNADLDKIVSTLDKVERQGSFADFVRHIPMVRELKRDGDRFTIELQFKVTILSVRFGAKMRATRESREALRFDYIEGEPEALSLRFAGHKLEDKALLQIDVAYDADSLGFLAKYFLKNHPEIRDGAYAGTAISIVEALRTAIETT
jgi:hypothetical protein